MAVVDYFLKIEGIDGESPDAKLKSHIQLESWSWGETNAGTWQYGSGGGAGKVQHQDFHFVMKVNKATPKLMLACAQGQHIKKAVLTCRKAGTDQQEYATWTFSDLLISSYQVGGSAHSDVVPQDQISFNFAKLEMEYKEQKADGTLGGSTKANLDYKTQKYSA